MCGRYALYQTDDLRSRFNLAAKPLLKLADNYNAAPGQFMPVITSGEKGNQEELMKWGFIPHWAKDTKIGYKLINTRSETVFEKPMWRSAATNHRCLVPARGFYEWKVLSDGKTKQPYFVHPKDQDLPALCEVARSRDELARAKMVLSEGEVLIDTSKEEKPFAAEIVRSGDEGALHGAGLFAFAGLWSTWRDVEGREIKSFSIMTTGPNKEMASVHNRMPVMLKPSEESLWLEPSLKPRDGIEPLLHPYEDEKLKIYKVSLDVNNPRHNDKHLIYQLAD